MKQYLLPEEGKYYKANLHCHSTISDGKLTPEELRDAYKAHGYSVLAITDHEMMWDHTDLTQEDFLMLNGYEIYVKERLDDPRFMKTCHMNLIAKTPDVKKMICVDPNYIKYAAKHGLKPEDLPRVGDICNRRYGPRCVNCMIKTAKENGYLVAYNHPSWSLESWVDIAPCEGMYALEVYNHATAHSEGFTGDDTRVYDQLLRLGKKMWVLANDDNHNKLPFEDPLCDSFGGFNMIKAKELSYSAIIEALEKGEFYASQGPEIHDLYVENGKVIVDCSDVKFIHLITAGRTAARGHNRQRCAKEGEYLNHGELELMPDDQYFRVEVTDWYGRKAMTHAYFLEDLDTSDIQKL